jgi:hypothetical protein
MYYLVYNPDFALEYSSTFSRRRRSFVSSSTSQQILTPLKVSQSEETLRSTTPRFSSRTRHENVPPCYVIGCDNAS